MISVHKTSIKNNNHSRETIVSIELFTFLIKLMVSVTLTYFEGHGGGGGGGVEKVTKMIISGSNASMEDCQLMLDTSGKTTGRN